MQSSRPHRSHSTATWLATATVCLIASALLLAPGAAASQAGLVVLPGRDGCLGHSTKHERCKPVRGEAKDAYAVALSPDGRNVYVVGRHGGPGARDAVGVIDVFARDSRTDELRQLPGTAGCVGAVAGCAYVPMSYIFDAQSTAQAIIVSPDGRNAYVATSARIFVFARDPKIGALTPLPGAAGCVADMSFPDGCTPARSLAAQALAISADGRDVYATGGDALSAFARDPATGALAQLPGSGGCVNYAGSDGCAASASLQNTSGIAVSPEGRNVYVTSPGGGVEGEGSLSVFARDPITGGVSQLAGTAGCLSVNPSLSGPGCARSGFAEAPASVLVSPDGRQLYVAAAGGPLGPPKEVVGFPPRAVVEFARDTSTGTVRGVACLGSLSFEGRLAGARCAHAHVIPSAFAIALTASGRRLVVGSIGKPELGLGTGDMVSSFDRDTTTGALKQPRGGAGCITDIAPRMTDFPEEVRGCTFDRTLTGAEGLALTANGEAAYIAGRVIQILITPLVAIPPQRLSLTRSRRVRIRLTCLQGPGLCTGRLTLRTADRFRLGRHRVFVSLGALSFSIRAGKSRVLAVRVPGGSFRALRGRGFRRLGVLAAATASRDGHTHPAESVLSLTL